MRSLITADLHLYDHHSHKFGDASFRLNQYPRLAKRLGEIYKAYQCEDIKILGDLMDHPVVQPYELHQVFDFMSILLDAVQANRGKIQYISGQHDTSTKSNTITEKDTIINLLRYLDPTTIKYMDRKSETIDGISTAYQSWRPEQDLTWLSSPVDILFGHVTLSKLFGQLLDPTQFGILFAGDIHQKQSYGNCHTVNSPICHRLGDDPDGSIIILETNLSEIAESELASWTVETLKSGKQIAWKRVLVIDANDPETHFLRLYRPDNKPVNAGSYLYDKEIPYIVVKDFEETNLHKSLKIDTIIEKTLVELPKQIREIHERVNGKIASTVPDPINMRFQNIQTILHNYRSHKDTKIEWNLIDQNAVILLSGTMGAGKSSVFEAIKYVWLGQSRNVKKQICLGESDLFVDHIVKYEGVFHRVKRGVEKGGFLEYWRGNSEQVLNQSFLSTNDEAYYPSIPANNIRDLQVRIRQELRFLDLMDILYIDQFSNGLLRGISVEARLKMLAQLFGFDKVRMLHDTAKMELDEIEKEISSLEKEISSLNTLKSSYIEQQSTFDIADFDDLESKLVATQTDLNLIKVELKSHRASLIGAVKKESLQSQLNSSEVELSLLPSTEVSVEALDSINTEIDEVTTSIIETKEIINAFEKLTTLTIEKDFLTKGIPAKLIKLPKNTVEELIDTNNDKLTILRNKEKDNTVGGSLYSRLVATEKRLGTSLKSIQSQIKSVKNDTCTECGQSFEYHQDKLDALYKELGNSELALKEVKDKLILINAFSGSSAEQELKSGINLIQSRLQLLTKWLENSTRFTEVSNLLSDSNLIGSLPDSKVVLKSFEDKLKTLLASKSTLSNALFNQQIRDRIVKDIDDLTNEIARLPVTSRDRINLEISKLEKKSTTFSNELVSLQKLEIHKAQYLELGLKLTEFEERLASIYSRYSALEEKQELHTRYINLMSNSGSVIQSAMLEISEQLSDSRMKVITTKMQASGKEVPDFGIEYQLRPNRWIDYTSISGGQLLVVDLLFLFSLIKTVGGTGMLILDEAYKFIPEELISEYLAEPLTKLNCNTKIVTTHISSYPFYDKRINVIMNDKGYSKLEIVH